MARKDNLKYEANKMDKAYERLKCYLPQMWHYLNLLQLFLFSCWRKNEVSNQLLLNSDTVPSQLKTIPFSVAKIQPPAGLYILPPVNGNFMFVSINGYEHK